jgi:hypothetical protein
VPGRWACLGTQPQQQQQQQQQQRGFLVVPWEALWHSLQQQQQLQVQDGRWSR